MPEALETPHSPMLSSMLPIQASFAGSNRADRLPNSGSNATVCTKVAITVPSFAAMSLSQLAAVTPLAPAMFCTTTLGLPGMCRAKCRARVRA
jgi:hypothetical protein